MTAALAHLATLAGVVDHWVDASGYRHVASDVVLREVLSAMGLDCATPAQVLASTARLGERRRLPPPLLTTWIGMPTRLGFALPTPAPFRLVYEDGAIVEGQVFDADGSRWLPPVLHAGYHRLEIAGARIRLAVAPLQACSTADLGPARPRLWGLSIESHCSLDHDELALLARHAAGHGADALAVGDLHDGDRRWLDAARIDLGQTFDSAVLADGDQTATLRQLYQVALPRDEVLLREYLRFARDGGEALQACAVHAALRRLHGDKQATWPQAFAGEGTVAAGRFAADHAEEVGFEVFVQWLATRSQRAAQAAARAAGMAIGLIADLPWGARRNGSDAWLHPQRYLRALPVADSWHVDGVEMTTSDAIGFDPFQLVDDGYRPWIELLRAAMTGVGAIRLLRVDRWQRAWLQSTLEAGAGAYVEQPFDDLLRLLVLESVRQRCVVFVDGVERMPDRWSQALAQVGLLRHQNFLQHDGTQWKASTQSPVGGVVASSGRDTPSLHAWWHGADIRQRMEHATTSALVAARELRQRDQERSRLLGQLGIERRQRPRAWQDERSSHPARAVPQRAAVETVSVESQWIDATVVALGQAPAALVLVALDDLLADAADGIDATSGRALASRLDATAVRNRMSRLDESRRGDMPAPVIGSDAGTG